MNWKSIAIHALLLLAVGIAYGILEPQLSSDSPKVLLLSYLIAECALHLVNASIFAHLAFKAEAHSFAHTLLALLLSHEAASVLLNSLLLYLQVQPSTRPLPMFLFEYALLLGALAAGTFVGVRLRCRKHTRPSAAAGGAANA